MPNPPTIGPANAPKDKEKLITLASASSIPSSSSSSTSEEGREGGREGGPSRAVRIASMAGIAISPIPTPKNNMPANVRTHAEGNNNDDDEDEDEEGREDEDEGGGPRSNSPIASNKAPWAKRVDEGIFLESGPMARPIKA